MARAWSGVGGAAEAPERKLSVIAVRLLKNCPSSFNLAYSLFGRLLPVTSRRGLDKYSNQNVKHLLRRAVHLVGRVVSASIVTNSISNAGSLVELMPHANYVACLLAARFIFIHPLLETTWRHRGIPVASRPPIRRHWKPRPAACMSTDYKR
jgi:hypothetical protein